jgi:glycerol uptake facilitator protein/aquaporin Z
MNPAISLAMWRHGTFSGRGVAYYSFAQLAGSVIGVLVGRLVWGVAAGRPPVTDATLHPAPCLTHWELFFLETLTMAIMILIVGVVIALPRIAFALPLMVGVLVGGAIASLGTATGGSDNPARQFGPAVVSGHTNLLSIYLIAPLAGTLVAPPLKAKLLHRNVTTHALCGTMADKD